MPNSGIVNHGNDCFISSVIQILTTDIFLVSVKRIINRINFIKEKEKEWLTTKKTRLQDKFELLIELEAVLETVRSGKSVSYDKFMYCLRRNRAGFVSSGIFNSQQDAHEFYLFATAIVSELSAAVNPWYGFLNFMRVNCFHDLSILNPFEGVLINRIKCMDCGTSSDNLENFTSLTISPTNFLVFNKKAELPYKSLFEKVLQLSVSSYGLFYLSTLHVLLPIERERYERGNSYTNDVLSKKFEEYLNSLYCACCCGKTSKTRQTILLQEPRIYCLQVQRKFYNLKEGTISKNKSPIEFQKFFLLKLPFLFWGEDKLKYKQRAEAEVKRIALHLLGVICHFDLSSTLGHYYTVKAEEDNFFYMYNDDVVNKVSRAFLGSRKIQKESYLFFYSHNLHINDVS
eukprot:snap_masked-scaffold_3-processed-gene-10.27-mRNA-1 protein AED:1.00 eAED:1.00 QI:0/0/0/0/1/1/2/0/400